MLAQIPDSASVFSRRTVAPTRIALQSRSSRHRRSSSLKIHISAVCIDSSGNPVDFPGTRILLQVTLDRRRAAIRSKPKRIIPQLFRIISIVIIIVIGVPAGIPAVLPQAIHKRFGHIRNKASGRGNALLYCILIRRVFPIKIKRIRSLPPVWSHYLAKDICLPLCVLRTCRIAEPIGAGLNPGGERCLHVPVKVRILLADLVAVTRTDNGKLHPCKLLHASNRSRLEMPKRQFLESSSP